ncbi:MAG: DinB family protein [Stygiobacter sp.]
MTYHSLAEIYGAKSATLQRLHQHIQGLTSAQASFHPSNGGWSIAEIVEHLSIVESQLLQLITALIKKTEEAGKTDSMILTFEVSLQSIFERIQTEKYSTRDKFLPSGKMTVSDSLQMLRDIQTQLHSLQPRLQSVDLTFATFPHWIFGPLNLGQWFAFIGLHEETHLAQIESILTSPGFPH